MATGHLSTRCFQHCQVDFQPRDLASRHAANSTDTRFELMLFICRKILANPEQAVIDWKQEMIWWNHSTNDIDWISGLLKPWWNSNVLKFVYFCDKIQLLESVCGGTSSLDWLLEKICRESKRLVKMGWALSNVNDSIWYYSLLNKSSVYYLLLQLLGI
jgi:hypothetical protein